MSVLRNFKVIFSQIVANMKKHVYPQSGVNTGFFLQRSNDCRYLPPPTLSGSSSCTKEVGIVRGSLKKSIRNCRHRQLDVAKWIFVVYQNRMGCQTPKHDFLFFKSRSVIFTVHLFLLGWGPNPKWRCEKMYKSLDNNGFFSIALRLVNIKFFCVFFRSF